MNDLAIETHALHKHYGDIRAVDGLDMHVPRGAVYGFSAATARARPRPFACWPAWPRFGGEMRVLGLDPASTALPSSSAPAW